MNKYKILLNGRNLLAEVEGHFQKLGFYTTRVVEANSPEEASSLAITLIRQDTRLQRMMRNEPHDPPTFFVEEVSNDSEEATDTGFSFYKENA